MTERKSFDPSHLIPMGLFREGVHTDTEIVATSLNGKKVHIKVTPNYVTEAEGTMFIPAVGCQQEALRELFPPRRHNI